MLVLLLAAHVGLVYFNRAGVRLIVLCERLAESMRHEPRRFLRHVEIPVELHGRHALQAGDGQIDRIGPLLEGYMGPRQGRACADGELEPTGPAPVGHGLLAGDRGRVCAVAVGADRAVGPALRLEPLAGRLLIREHLAQLNEADSHTKSLAGCFVFCHDGDTIPRRS